MTLREFAKGLYEALLKSDLGDIEGLRNAVESGTLDHNDSVTGPMAGSRIDLEMLDGSTVEIIVRKFP